MSNEVACAYGGLWCQPASPVVAIGNRGSSPPSLPCAIAMAASVSLVIEASVDDLCGKVPGRVDL